MDIGKLALQLSLSPGSFYGDVDQASRKIQTLNTTANAAATGVMGTVAAAAQSFAGINLAGPIGQVGSLMSTLGSVASIGLSGFATGVIAAGGALLSFASSGMKAMAAQSGLSERFRISTEAVAGLQFAAERFGVDQDTLSHGLGIFARKLGDVKTELNSGHGGPMIAALQRLGLDAREFTNLPIDQAFASLSTALKNTADPAERAAAMFAILGRQGEALEPLLRRGGGALEESARQARALGVAANGVDAKNVRDALKTTKEAGAFLGTIVQSLGMAIGAGIAPAVSTIGKAIKAMVLGVQPILGILRDVFQGIASAVSFVITVVADGMSPVLAVFGQFAEWVGAAWRAVTGLGAGVGTMLAPIKGLLSALVTIGATLGSGLVVWAVLLRTWSAITGIAGMLRTGFLAIASGIGTATNGLSAFKATLLSTGIGALVVGIGALISNFNGTGQSAREAADEIARLRTVAANHQGTQTGQVADQLANARQQLADLNASRAGAGWFGTSIGGTSDADIQQMTALGQRIQQLERQLQLVQQTGQAMAANARLERDANQRLAEHVFAQADSLQEQRAAVAMAQQASQQNPGVADAGRLAQSVQQTVQALREQRDTAGMSADEVQRWRLLQQGAGDDVMANVRNLQQMANVAQNLAQAQQNAVNHASGWEDQVRFAGMTAREIEIARMQAQGVDELVIDWARQADANLTALERQNELRRQAVQLGEQLLSPQEKFWNQQQSIQDLLDEGLITQNEFDLATARHLEEFDRASGTGHNIRGGEALQEGSAGAISAVNRAIVAAKLEGGNSPQERIATLLQRADERQQRLLEEAREQRRALQELRRLDS